MEKYQMNNKLFILILTAFLIISFIVGCQYGKMRSEGFKTSDTVTVNDTIWKDTTIWKEKPVPKIVKVVKTDTVFTEKGDTIQLVTENKIYQDTIVCKKDTAELQIFISGINAQIDSINLKLRKSEIIKTNTITITKYIEKPKKLITVRPQLGVGYGLIHNNVDMYVGIGLHYDW